MNALGRTTRHDRLRLKTLVAAMLLAQSAQHALADPLDGAVEFDAGMLGAAHQDTDLSRFAHGNPVDAGEHDVQLVVNTRTVARRSVRFALLEGRALAQPCIDDALLDAAGVRMDARDATATGDCLTLDQRVAGATAHYDAGDYLLTFSIPQASLELVARGTTDPSTWDAGITAARLNYSANTYVAQVDGQPDVRSGSLHLDAGANLGAWRVRHRSMHHWSGQGRDSRVLSAYAQTDLPAHRAQFTAGDFQTTGLLFDSIGLRGVRLESDERMYPDSLRGYAPVVEGIAHGNAVVTIRQNGNVIHEVNVPAGPFVIRDLYPTGYGGALDVTVTEADGRQAVFIVPYSSVVQLLRPDMTRFSFAAGQWQGFGAGEKPMVVQATGQRGINNLVTAYTGFQSSEDYLSLLAGTALNTRMGAFAFDVTNAWSQSMERAMSGQTYRLSYSQFLPTTNTTVMVAAHRHSTRDYWSLADQIAYRDEWRDASATQRFARARNQFELQLNQPIGRGTLYASTALRDYWDSDTPERNAQVSYAWTMGKVGLSLAGRWRDSGEGGVGEAYFNVSMPLGSTRHASHRVTANGGYARDRKGHGMVSLTGSGLEEQRGSYGVTASKEGNGGTLRTSANVAYQGSAGRVGLMASLADGQHQVSANADGGLLWHAGGITASPAMSETVGVVRAHDATGARLPGAPGVRIDRRGYAVVPSLSPYRNNTIDIDPRGVHADVRFRSTTQDVVPRAGAVVMLPFDTVRERSWMLRAQRSDGEHAPFGAQVRDANGAVLGMVGQNGLAFLSGEPADGALRVQWGDGEHEQCHVENGRPAIGDAGLLPHVEARCTAPREEG